jgi:hypothetical protein
MPFNPFMEFTYWNINGIMNGIMNPTTGNEGGMKDVERTTISIGSLFDGSGTAPLAAAILGWTPLWASEIEPYPVAVT